MLCLRDSLFSLGRRTLSPGSTHCDERLLILPVVRPAFRAFFELGGIACFIVFITNILKPFNFLPAFSPPAFKALQVDPQTNSEAADENKKGLLNRPDPSPSP